MLVALPLRAATIGQVDGEYGIGLVRPADVQNADVTVTAVPFTVIFGDHDPVSLPEMVGADGNRKALRRHRIDCVTDGMVQLRHRQVGSLVVRRKYLHGFSCGIPRHGFGNHRIFNAFTFRVDQTKVFIVTQITTALQVVKVHHIVEQRTGGVGLPVIAEQPIAGSAQFQQIRENIAGPNRQKLIGIAQQNHAAAGRHSVQNTSHHFQSQHAGLIHDHQIYRLPPDGGQKILVCMKSQSTVYRSSGQTGTTGQIPGSLSSGGTQDGVALAVEHFNDGLDQRALSASGAAQNQREPKPQRHFHRIALFLAQRDVVDLKNFGQRNGLKCRLMDDIYQRLRCTFFITPDFCHVKARTFTMNASRANLSIQITFEVPIIEILLLLGAFFEEAVLGDGYITVEAQRLKRQIDILARKNSHGNHWITSLSRQPQMNCQSVLERQTLEVILYPSDAPAEQILVDGGQVGSLCTAVAQQMAAFVGGDQSMRGSLRLVQMAGQGDHSDHRTGVVGFVGRHDHDRSRSGEHPVAGHCLRQRSKPDVVLVYRNRCECTHFDTPFLYTFQMISTEWRLTLMR